MKAKSIFSRMWKIFLLEKIQVLFPSLEMDEEEIRFFFLFGSFRKRTLDCWGCFAAKITRGKGFECLCVCVVFPFRLTGASCSQKKTEASSVSLLLFQSYWSQQWFNKLPTFTSDESTGFQLSIPYLLKVWISQLVFVNLSVSIRLGLFCFCFWTVCFSVLCPFSKYVWSLIYLWLYYESCSNGNLPNLIWLTLSDTIEQ